MGQGALVGTYHCLRCHGGERDHHVITWRRAAHGGCHLSKCADVTFGIEEIESCSGILPKASGVEPLQHAIAANIHGIDRGDLNDRNPPRSRGFGGNACGVVALTTV